MSDIPEKLKDIFLPVDKAKEVRCPDCNRMMFKGPMPRDAIEVKCPRCGRKTRFKRIS